MDMQKMNSFVNSRAEVLHRWTLSDCKSPKAICIMVHGLHEHIQAYNDLATEMLKTDNIALHGYDQVGHGLSEGKRAEVDEFRYLVNDLLEFVQLIKHENNHTPIYIMGHDMGGLVLGLALLKEPNLCDGAIMYSAMIQTHDKLVFSTWATAFLSSYVPWFPVGCFEPSNLTRNKTEVHRLKTDPCHYQGGIKARFAQSMFDAIAEFNPRMSLITTPMLILHGTEDAVCLNDGSRLLHDTIASSQRTLKIYRGAYHRLHSEPDGVGEQFIVDVCDWISSQVKQNQG